MSNNLCPPTKKVSHPQSSQSTTLSLSKKYFSTNNNEATDVLSSFLTYIFNDISKRANKPFDMFTLTELTDLPLILCEKICYLLSPQNGILSLSQFMECMYNLFFCKSDDKNSRRLLFICKLCDFKKKNIIMKNDVLILLLHMHMHSVPYSYQNELIDIVNIFFGKKGSMSTSSFLNKTLNINGDIAYLFYLFLDKFSFGNYEQLDLFNKEIFNGKEKIEKFTTKKYKMDYISKQAIDYGNKIVKAKIEKEAFDEDSDEQLDDLDNFENEISQTMNNFGSLRKSYSNLVTDIHTFSTGTTSDFHRKTHHSKESDGLSPLTEENREGVFEKTERVNKTLELFSKNRGFFFSSLNIHPTRRAASTKRTYDCPLKDFREDSAIDPQTFPVHPYNEIICLKQSKKQKGLIQVKLIHIDNFLFYFKSIPNTCTEALHESPTKCSFSSSSNKNLVGPSGSPSSHSNNTTISYNYNVNSNYVQTKYILKRIILTKRLYPTIIKYPNKIHFQLQLTTSLHNTQSVINFYSQNEILLVSFAKTLSQSQHQCGRNITDVYELSHEVGKGKFGSVSIATHRVTSKQVAIKVVSKIEFTSEESFKSNKWENDIFKFLQNASVGCENIIRCYEFFETPNYLYYVTEYVPDGNLKNYILEAMNNNTKISEKDVNEICKQMLNGIAFLHSYGIIHRDVKHTNTLIEKAHNTDTVIRGYHNNRSLNKASTHSTTNHHHHHINKLKIIDFGLSKAMGYEDSAIEPYGSLSFKAPEVILENPYSFSADLWSLGITIYYVMFHKFPVKANDKNSLKEKICSENYLGTMIQKGVTFAAYASKVIFQCLVKDPNKRIKADALLCECK